MAAWKLAPALAAGNAVVLKPAETSPVSVAILLELIGHLLPPGVVNVVHGLGPEAGAALATSKRIAKIAFTGSTQTGKQVAAAAAANLIPATLELGGKSPNIFFKVRLPRGFLASALHCLPCCAGLTITAHGRCSRGRRC